MVDGTSNYLNAIWKLVGSVVNYLNNQEKIKNKNKNFDIQKLDNELYKVRNWTISTVII